MKQGVCPFFLLQKKRSSSKIPIGKPRLAVERVEDAISPLYWR
jgi:hypothetical protein